MYSFILLMLIVLSSASSLLTCDGPTVSCPGSVITCYCNGALDSFDWHISDCMIRYPNQARPVGVIASVCDDQHSVVLNSEEIINGDRIFTSTLYVTLRENLTVTCGDASGLSEDVMLTVASKHNQSLEYNLLQLNEQIPHHHQEICYTTLLMTEMTVFLTWE